MKSFTTALLIICYIISSSCSGKKLDPQLKQGVASFKYMTSQKFLSKSAFKTSYPEQKPSEYVKYIFSTLGSAEWPIAFDPSEEEALRSARIPVFPRDLTVVPDKPDPKINKQLVIRSDDTNGKIIIEAYEKAGEPSVLTVERNLK